MSQDNFLFQSQSTGTFNGVDIKASIVVPELLVSTLGPTVELSNLNTISWSTHRDKVPVRRLGKAYSQGYTRGTRTIAGSMVFVNFNQAALWSLIGEHYQVEDSPVHSVMTDQLLPFDMNFLLVNEDGLTAFMSLFGVEIVDEGMVLGTDEAYLETTMQYVAVDMDLLNPGPKLREIWDTVGKETIRIKRTETFEKEMAARIRVDQLTAFGPPTIENVRLLTNDGTGNWIITYFETMEQSTAYMKGLTSSAQRAKFMSQLKAYTDLSQINKFLSTPAVIYDAAGNPHLDLSEYHDSRIHGAKTDGGQPAFTYDSGIIAGAAPRDITIQSEDDIHLDNPPPATAVINEYLGEKP